MKHVVESTTFQNLAPRTARVAGSIRGRERPRFGRLSAAQNPLRSFHSLGGRSRPRGPRSLRVNARPKENGQ